MTIKIEDLDLLPILTGSDILSMIFGDDVLKYSYHFSDPCPNRLKLALDALRDFEKWVETAMQVKSLEVSERGGTFYRHAWEKDNLFRWLQANEIFRRLEERGVRVADVLKKVVEASNKLETIDNKAGGPINKGPAAESNKRKAAFPNS